MERYDPQAGITSDPNEQEDISQRRKAGRLGADMIACQFGPVVDLSSGGMRVMCRKVPTGQRIPIQLVVADEKYSLLARVAWSRRIGLFKHEAGFQFLDVDPTMARKLTQIATTGRMRRSV